jgi:hypothetical protein
VITLGSAGDQLTVILAAGGDFIASMTASSPWGDVQISLELSGGTTDPVTWTAVISDVTATFDVPKEQVQAVIDAKMSTARLYYTPTTGTTLLWAQGGISAY